MGRGSEKCLSGKKKPVSQETEGHMSGANDVSEGSLGAVGQGAGWGAIRGECCSCQGCVSHKPGDWTGWVGFTAGTLWGSPKVSLQHLQRLSNIGR